jgi:signal transduction histidine kinase
VVAQRPVLAARQPGLVEQLLRAALVNLALNAIDATGGGGHVTIAASVGGGRVTLAVEDDGPGPPPELGTALAEPFVTGKQEGVGLGLSVARAVAEQHGGTLAWQRADGRTRFTIALPKVAIATTHSHKEPVA